MRWEIEEAIVRIRKVLEERGDPELKYAFVGAPTIRTELKRTSLRPLPSVRAVERALQRRKLTQPRRKLQIDSEATFCGGYRHKGLTAAEARTDFIPCLLSCESL